MKEIISPPNYVEEDGEIKPSYTGVNAPRYPRTREAVDMQPGSEIDSSSVNALEYNQRDENVPGHEVPAPLTDTDRAIGLAAIKRIRE